MKIGTIGLTASVVIAFSAGLLGPTLWKEIHRPSSVPTDLVRVDLNDLRIMQQLDEERDYLIATGREVDTIDYTAIESRDLYSYQWGVIRGGIGSYIIMTPSSSAALYYIYRDHVFSGQFHDSSHGVCYEPSAKRGQLIELQQLCRNSGVLPCRGGRGWKFDDL